MKIAILGSLFFGAVLLGLSFDSAYGELSANNAFFIVNTQQLATNTSVEILTLPLIVEGGTILKYITAGTMSDGVDIGISYLNILKAVTT